MNSVSIEMRSVANAEERWCLEKNGDEYRQHLIRTPMMDRDT